MNKVILLSLIFFELIGHSQNKNIFDIARKGSLAEIQLAYKTNPNSINDIDERKSSTLILAAYRGNTEVALFLADKVKDINYNSGMGSALMAAVMADKLEIVEKLISLKADLNQKDSDGKTALIYAVFFNKNDIAKALIKAKADKTIKDNASKTALDFANFNKNTELIILLDQ